MTTVLPAVLALAGVVFTATWTVVGYSHRFRARRSIQSEIELWNAMPKGQAHRELRRHVDARVRVYMKVSCDAGKVMWSRIVAMAFGLVSVVAGVILLWPEMTRASWGRVFLFGGLVVGLVGLVLFLGGRAEQTNAAKLARMLQTPEPTGGDGDTPTP
jgi:hypothetical protein